MVFDQGAFKEKCLNFGLGQDDFEVNDFTDEGCRLDVELLLLEVAAYPVFQRFGFSDVNDRPAGVFHEVDTRGEGQGA